MIRETHKRNLELIKKYDLKVGDKFKLRKSLINLKVGEEVTIKHIHSLYGWILFKESEQLSQEVRNLLNSIELKGNEPSNSLGCGKKIRNRNNKQIEVKENPDFICGVANAWGKEYLCFICDFNLKESWKKDKIKDNLKGGIKI